MNAEPYINVTFDGKPLGYWEQVELAREIPTTVAFPDHAAALLYGGFKKTPSPIQYPSQVSPPSPPHTSSGGGGPVPVAYCPDHGLHGSRLACFECGEPVKQVVMVPVRRLAPVLEVFMTEREMRIYNRLPALGRALFLTALDIRDILFIGSTRKRVMR